MPLFLKSSATDPQWVNPIGVIGGQNPSTPVMDGSVHQMRARVGSEKEDFDHVHVQFWMCAYGTAGMPYLDSAGGTGGTTWPPDDGNPALTHSVVAGGLVIVDADWTPAPSDITWPQTGDLHVCMLANAYATDGNNNVVDGQPIVSQPPVFTPGNNRQGQRNLTLIIPPKAKRVDFMMFAGHPFADGKAKYTLEVQELLDHRMGQVELDDLLFNKWLKEEKGNLVAGKDHVPIRLAEKPLRRLELELEGECGRELQQTFEAGNPQQFRLQADVEEDENVLRFIDVVQYDEQREIVGGARAMVLTVPEELRVDPTCGDYAE